MSGYLIYLGTAENIHCILDVDIKSEAGASLCLAHKTSTWYLGGGVNVRDDGYVLGEVSGLYKGDGKIDAYYPLEPSDIAEYQAEGLLPDPLPSYSIPFGDYATGYSLWIVLALLAAYELWKRWRGVPQFGNRASSGAQDSAAPI